MRDKLIWENDSVWINEQLVLRAKPFNKNGIKYKLVKIGKRAFTEGPHEILKPFSQPDPITFNFGDSSYSILGKKIYTYIGNSSWGYYYEYHLNRVFPAKLLNFKMTEPGYCEHGHDQLLGRACFQCLHTYRLKYDSNYRENYEKNSAIKEHQIPVGDCNHGHICCEVGWCDCCPEDLRKKSTTTFSLPKTEIPVCKHGYNQNLGQICLQCRNEERLKQDSASKSLTNPNLEPENKTFPNNAHQYCNHSHNCCDVGCNCCPEITPVKKTHLGGIPLKNNEIESIAPSDCAHSHDCCTSNCQCCGSLSQKEKRQLIRLKKRTNRKNIRKMRIERIKKSFSN